MYVYRRRRRADTKQTATADGTGWGNERCRLPPEKRSCALLPCVRPGGFLVRRGSRRRQLR